MPYLDGETADKGYRAIQRHLDGCQECQAEIRTLKSLDSLIRLPEFELEVPPYQWQRIRARIMEDPVAPNWRGWLVAVLKPSKLAVSITMSLLLIFGMVFFGWEYRRHLTEDQLLAIASYSETERQRVGQAENPFRTYSDAPSDENPFTRFQTPIAGNPFAVR